MTYTVSRIISDESLSCGIQIESNGVPTAKAKTSSATGLAQFLNATWLEVVRGHQPAWFNNRTTAQVLALRTDPRKSIEMMARFWEDNAKALGAGYTDGDLYLAHFSGVGTARRVLRADAGTPAGAIFSPAAVKANKSILAGKTCGQVRAWASSKMAKAKGRNWVAVYMTGAKPVASPAVKNTVKAATASPVVVGPATASAGWSGGEIAVAVIITIIVIGAIGYAVHRFWPHRAPVKVEEI